MKFIEDWKLGLCTLCFIAANMTGCTQIEVNTILDQRAMAPEDHPHPEEFLCNITLKLTCFTGVMCNRTVSIQSTT